MKEITCGKIVASAQELCIRAATTLTPDIALALECAYETESSDESRTVIAEMVKNLKNAAYHKSPVCPNISEIVIFADVGQNLHITDGLLENAVRSGVLQGLQSLYPEVPSTVYPFKSERGDDLSVHIRLTSGDKLSLTVALFPEGYSFMKVFPVSALQEEVEAFLLDAVRHAGKDLCPPLIIGAGLGGTTEMAGILAKRALIRPVDLGNPDAFYARMERRTLNKINNVHLGTLSLGGKNTALSVNLETFPVSSSMLPCVVCISSHAVRHAECAL